MGDRDPEAKPADRRFIWVGERICSSLKVKDDSYQKLLASENKYAPDLSFTSKLHPECAIVMGTRFLQGRHCCISRQCHFYNIAGVLGWKRSWSGKEETSTIAARSSSVLQ